MQIAKWLLQKRCSGLLILALGMGISLLVGCQQAGPDAALQTWIESLRSRMAAADEQALNFAVDAALAADTELIAEAQPYLDDPREAWRDAAAALLPELYLLRAQHRLYLYEWEAVLEDINAALAFDTAPANAYYYRGLTYFSQYEPEYWALAQADFEHYLVLETDADSPLIIQAEQYLQMIADAPPIEDSTP